MRFWLFPFWICSCLLPLTDRACAWKIEVLASFAPICCFARNVAGDAADVSMLLPPNTGPHSYSFSPSDIEKIAKADVIVINGIGLEGWLQKGIRNSAKPNVLVADTSRRIELLTGPETKPLAGVKAAPDPDAGGPNPHVWLSPVNAMKQVENVRDALVSKDPANAKTYQMNAAEYIARLRKLDAEVRKQTASLQNKKLITFHDTFPYFAREYGLTIAATFEEFPGKEPSPRTLEQLRKIIRTERISALFAEPQYSPKAMQTLAQELKVPVVELDPMETGDGEADYYERVTRKNLSALVAAFHGAR